MDTGTGRRWLGVSSALALALASALAITSMASATGAVVHHVSVGGPDNTNFWCQDGQPHPGCDGNFSLEVTQYADGTVKGQYTDQYAQGDGGIHAVLDCLVVDGNTAWVSGHVVSGGVPSWPGGEDWTGWDIATVVRDNGTSANDPADQISYTWYQGPISPPAPSGNTWAPRCTEEHPAWFLDNLTDMPKGQVNVR
jgi:hypothetical protein